MVNPYGQNMTYEEFLKLLKEKDKMIKEFKVENKKIQIYCKNSTFKELPVVILNTYGDEGKGVFDQCTSLKCQDFILVAISNLDWNNDMTPWFAPKLNSKDVDCLGKADEYIKILIDKIIPQVEEYIIEHLKIQIEYFTIAGYSLAGLFAVYSAYKTDIFTKIVSASGSFWFPKFMDFVKENRISSNIKKIYFSLGNKESNTRNQILATVEKNTIELEKIYHHKGIETIYEENDGNHFKDAILRMAKGINWILRREN